MMSNLARLAAAPLAALALAACTPADDGASSGGALEPSSATLAASLKAGGELDSLESVVAAAGLESVLEGVGPYTVFAPTDAAFGAAGPGDLTSEENSAPAAALLRAHIVPGALTRQDILSAMVCIDANQTGKVEMHTMADSLLSFSRDGETVVVTAPDGATARLTGEQTLARNGVIQPVDGVLVKPEA
jgi:uncharacterized surface protein with fasciclin (FAS1) repeats